MACVITYKNNKYSQQEFEKYFKNNFNEFINEFLSQDIEGFKEFVKNDVQQSFTTVSTLPGKGMIKDRLVNIIPNIPKENIQESTNIQESFAIMEEEPFNSLPSKKEVYSRMNIWDSKLNRPKTWGMNVDKASIVRIAQNINNSKEFKDIYSAKVAQQPFLDKGKYVTKQYVQLTMKEEMNDLTNRIDYLMNSKEKLEELMKTCKY